MQAGEYIARNGYYIVAELAEWLRRLTRNQLGSARAGSNPALREDPFSFRYKI